MELCTTSPPLSSYSSSKTIMTDRHGIDSRRAGWGRYGQRAASSSQQPAASSQQPAASSSSHHQQQQQPAASSQQPAASGQQPAASGQQPAASSSRAEASQARAKREPSASQASHGDLKKSIRQALEVQFLKKQPNVRDAAAHINSMHTVV